MFIETGRVLTTSFNKRFSLSIQSLHLGVSIEAAVMASATAIVGNLLHSSLVNDFKDVDGS